MSERQTKHRRNAQNLSWYYWLSETNTISAEVWRNACLFGDGMTTTVTSARPDAGFTTVAQLRAAMEALRVVDRPDSNWIYFHALTDRYGFDPRMQGPPRPLEDLVQSVLDYEGLDDDDQAMEEVIR